MLNLNAQQLIDNVDASRQTLFSLLNKMVDANILASFDKAKNSTFMCTKLLSIIDN